MTDQFSSQINQEESPEQLEDYFGLIDKLLSCPNGQEPEIIRENQSLIDADFIKAALKVATIFAHEGNQEGAEFLVHIARELSKELGYYPNVETKE
ncbi:hypothetical protein [Calothrix sp. PCC 6303]|uniref:hypothetical protein n=1 Tax=Calothrix sp. PCC 6303 TaxID=1170562 RepID=UPI0002A00871|nr:hypothetical protein [Calothrix sp. PCC 6303]AFZ02840.1 hypothetical protein Cal6303_3923 [Calothrix sp. PCC 6303]